MPVGSLFEDSTAVTKYKSQQQLLATLAKNWKKKLENAPRYIATYRRQLGAPQNIRHLKWQYAATRHV